MDVHQRSHAPGGQACISHVQHEDRRSRVSEDVKHLPLRQDCRSRVSEDVKHLPLRQDCRSRVSEDVKHLPLRQDCRSRVSEDVKHLLPRQDCRSRASEDLPLGQVCVSHFSEACMFYKGLRVYPNLWSLMAHYHTSSLTRDLQSSFALRERGLQSFSLIVQIDRGNRRFFSRFVSIDQLETWYSRLLDVDRTLHEVITSDMRKLIIDIDDCNIDCMKMYDFERHIRSRIEYVFNELDIGHPDVLVYDICDDRTISYHLVVSNMAFTASTCLGLCLLISAGQVWEHMVDTSVYKSKQNMRMEGSTKYGERRWKRLYGHDTVVLSSNFRAGLLSVISGVHIPDIRLSVARSPVSFASARADVPHPHLSDSTCPSVYAYFKIRKVAGNTVFLDRIRPGMCFQCERIHMKENAIIRRGIFICWRWKN